METITKKIRKEIYNSLIDNDFVDFENLSESFNMNLLVLMFDYYNFLCFRQLNGEINEYDLQFLMILKSNSFENLFKTFKHNDYYILKALENNYVFNNLSILEQHNFMYDVHFSGYKNTITNNPLYISDMLGYMPFDKLEDIESSYREYFEICNKYNENDSVEEVALNLDALRNMDYIKYKEIMIKIIHNFYKLDKYRLKETKNAKLKNHVYHFLIKYLSDDNIVKFSNKNVKFSNEVLNLYFTCRTVFPNVVYEQIIRESEKDMPKKLIKKFNNNKKEN